MVQESLRAPAGLETAPRHPISITVQGQGTLPGARRQLRDRVSSPLLGCACYRVCLSFPAVGTNTHGTTSRFSGRWMSLQYTAVYCQEYLRAPVRVLHPQDTRRTHVAGGRVLAR